jgi:thiamine pyrophosphokinase
VLAGGDPLPAALAGTLAPVDLVVAADSGLEHARTLGVAVDLVVGDLDSVDPDVLASARAAGVAVERHPVAKDATDLELAIAAAVERGAMHVTVVGGHGGRVDHFVANALLLGAPRWASLELAAWIGTARIVVVRDDTIGDGATLDGTPGSLLSLLPAGGPAQGVTTAGLRFPLHDEDLEVGSTRGVSNELVATTAEIRLRAGSLLAVQPHALVDASADASPDALEER